MVTRTRAYGLTPIADHVRSRNDQSSLSAGHGVAYENYQQHFHDHFSDVAIALKFRLHAIWRVLCDRGYMPSPKPVSNDPLNSCIGPGCLGGRNATTSSSSEFITGAAQEEKNGEVSKTEFA